MSDLLTVRDLHVRYGMAEAVRGVDLSVESGQIVALLGANGAGKTTTLNAVVGSGRAKRQGSVRFADREVIGRSPERLVRAGLVMVPEGRRVLAPLSVEDNLLAAAYVTRDRREVHRRLGEVFELFTILETRRAVPAGVLSGGEQQMLAFGRAMMSQPRLMLLDEPSMGLAPSMVSRVMSAVLDLNERGATILMVEQNAAAALSVADHVYVLDRGRVVDSGTVEQIRTGAGIEQVFLGRRDEDRTSSS